MTAATLGETPLEELLAGDGLAFRVGPFSVVVRSHARELARSFRLLYSEYRSAPSDGFVDFRISVEPPNLLRRWVRRNFVYSFDGFAPFQPAPAHHAPPGFEWGLNWTITSFAHHYLIFHASVLERDGLGLLLPAPPGSGKSTLCAALAHSGWRLFSDELAIVTFEDLSLHSIARPINLKNESIELIRRFAPGAVFTETVPDTSKGAVALVKAPSEAVARMNETARPGWVVFPKWQAGAEPRLEPTSKAAACLEIGDSAFNYSFHGARGFEALTAIIDRSDCYSFTYSRLEDAVEIFAGLPPPGSTRANSA